MEPLEFLQDGVGDAGGPKDFVSSLPILFLAVVLFAHATVASSFPFGVPFGTISSLSLSLLGIMDKDWC